MAADRTGFSRHCEARSAAAIQDRKCVLPVPRLPFRKWLAMVGRLRDGHHGCRTGPPRLPPIMDTSPGSTVAASSLACAAVPAPTRVVSDSEILGGAPIVLGTRVPTATLVAYLRDEYSVAEIAEDYSTLPSAWLPAVEDWALREYGHDWRALSHQ